MSASNEVQASVRLARNHVPLGEPEGAVASAETEEEFGIEHLGIQAETPDELAELRERIDRAGGTVNNEGETTCCYANSDKTWVVDQQGVSWEAFYTSGEAETYYDEEVEAACC